MTVINKLFIDGCHIVSGSAFLLGFVINIYNSYVLAFRRR